MNGEAPASEDWANLDPFPYRYSRLSGDKVFKSTNGGNSWNATSQVYGVGWVETLILSPNYASDSTLFIGTWNGIYRSVTGGGSWGRMEGLGDIPLSLLLVLVPSETLFAGTKERGVWPYTIIEYETYLPLVVRNR